VRWAPRSEDRQLFEYFPTLEMADMAVTFMDKEPDTGRSALRSERSLEWARFERWFWSQAPDRLVNECLPAWVYRDRMTRRPAAPASPGDALIAVDQGRPDRQQHDRTAIHR
jgi:hypothetical protein